jgi:hypothetical protein
LTDTKQGIIALFHRGRGRKKTERKEFLSSVFLFLPTKMQTCDGGGSHDGVLAKAPCTCQKNFLAFAPSPCSNGGEALHCIRRTRTINSKRGGVWCGGEARKAREKRWKGEIEEEGEQQKKTQIAHFKCMNQHTPSFALDTKKYHSCPLAHGKTNNPFGMQPKGTRLQNHLSHSHSFLTCAHTHTHTCIYIYIYIYI